MTREQILASRWVKPFARHISSPLLWRLNRRGVARGVGLGLFAAFAVPFVQTPLAIALAIAGRANLPIAVSATFITNPLTIPFLYPLAYFMGAGLLHGEARAATVAADAGIVERILNWSISLAGPTYLGLLMLAAISAVLGYVSVHYGWRVHIYRKRRARRAQRLARPPALEIA